ncbi:MAG: hypothetical protein R3A48_24760 [Polyangiales bacterium]
MELHEVSFLRRGAEEGWYKVGPLARIQNCDRLHTALAEAAWCWQEFLAHASGAVVHAPLASHWARMPIEPLHAAEVMGEFSWTTPRCSVELVTGRRARRAGVGVLEAPRAP